ncbi:MAG: zinc ribbon domain-containing protein [Opitutaceae bacterium]|jgi:putative FmdB family regulatory protein
MPTYEYACHKCGHRFEQFQPMSAEPLKKCPKCGKSGLKRLVGRGAGLIFKGSGFYVTDYKKASSQKEGGESKAAPGGTAPAAAAGGGKAAESGAKPAEKSPPKA